MRVSISIINTLLLVTDFAADLLTKAAPITSTKESDSLSTMAPHDPNQRRHMLTRNAAGPPNAGDYSKYPIIIQSAVRWAFMNGIEDIITYARGISLGKNISARNLIYEAYMYFHVFY